MYSSIISLLHTCSPSTEHIILIGTCIHMYNQFNHHIHTCTCMQIQVMRLSIVSPTTPLPGNEGEFDCF